MKPNPVDESNRLIQQLNLVLVGGDCNGNDAVRPNYESEQLPPQGGNANAHYGYKPISEPEPPPPSQMGYGYLGKETTDPDAYSTFSEDFNDPAKVIGRVGEEHMKNVLFFLGFVAKFLQLVVASALLILAIEWKPLHNFIVEQVDNMFFSFLFLGLLCAGLLVIKFRGRFIIVLIVNMLFMVNFFWYMAASSFDFLVFSPYWIVLCAVTQTAACLFLSVLVYFQKVTYRGCGVFGYATIVPILFLVLSQPYYFWWYVTMTSGSHEDIKITRYDLAADEYTITRNSGNVGGITAIEHEKQRHDLIMSYPYYMINVCSGIGLAAVMTFEMVAWSQYSVKNLKFKAGSGILSNSFTGLADESTDNNAPVNL